MTEKELDVIASRMISPEEKVMLATGLEEAFIGIGRQSNLGVFAVYDKNKCIDILKQTMSEEEAEEYYQFNIQGAYVGESTPVFVELSSTVLP